MNRKKLIIYLVVFFVSGVGVGGVIGFKVLNVSGAARSGSLEPQPPQETAAADLSLGQLIVLEGLVDGKISRLGELIVLHGLFSGKQTGSAACRSQGRVSDLGQLLVLDRLFGDNPAATEGTSTAPVSRLGELLVLDGLFNQAGTCANSQ